LIFIKIIIEIIQPDFENMYKLRGEWQQIVSGSPRFSAKFLISRENQAIILIIKKRISI